MKRREEEFEEVCKKYPDVPRTFILKTDLLRRGVTFTRDALEKLQDPYYEHTFSCLFQWHQMDKPKEYELPLDFYFKDATRCDIRLSSPELDPYIIGMVDDRFWVLSNGEPLEEIFFSKKPDYYDKKTSSGYPMRSVCMAIGSDGLMVVPSRHCQMWDDGNQCLFCDMNYNTKLQMRSGKRFRIRVDPQDLYETVTEALKEKGKWRGFILVGGTDLKDGYDLYTDLVMAIKEAGKGEGERLPICTILPPGGEDQIVKLYEAGASQLGSNREVWDSEKFKLVCPGKARYIGERRWLERTIKAVEIFGEGNVFMTFVQGVEMAPPPYGLSVEGNIDQALNTSVEGFKFVLDHGIVPVCVNWTIAPGSVFYKIGAKQPPLEFYVKLDRERYLLEKRFGKGFAAYGVSYRRVGLACYSDWSRLL